MRIYLINKVMLVHLTSAMISNDNLIWWLCGWFLGDTVNDSTWQGYFFGLHVTLRKNFYVNLCCIST